jgi:hypothetical protein
MGCGCPKCDAAVEAHWAVAEELKTQLGRAPTLMEIAEALATAFGDVAGLLSAAGAKWNDIQALNDMAMGAANRTMRDVMVATSEGPIQ